MQERVDRLLGFAGDANATQQRAAEIELRRNAIAVNRYALEAAGLRGVEAVEVLVRAALRLGSLRGEADARRAVYAQFLGLVDDDDPSDRGCRRQS